MNNKNINYDSVLTSLREALEMLLQRDLFLINNDVNERSITHRLAIFLEKDSLFNDYKIDCEYNRDHDDSKKLNIRRQIIKSNDITGVTVFPDIIIHKRGENNNLVVIEVKKYKKNEKSTKYIDSIKYDYGKLKAFKTELKYEHAFFIKIGCIGKELVYEVFDEKENLCLTNNP